MPFTIRRWRPVLFAALAVTGVAWSQVCGAPGKLGPGTGLAGTLNSYYPGNGAVAIGATSIPLGAVDTTSGGASTAIDTNDLVIVMQMQGAEINSTNSNCYGDGLGNAGCATRAVTTGAGANNYAGGITAANYLAGEWEYCVAVGPVAGGNLIVRCAGAAGGTVNRYAQTAATGAVGAYTFQVIRVPQYSSASLGGNVTPGAWNGSTGGVASLQVAGTLTMAGFTIDAGGRGFRGGGVTFLAPFGPPVIDPTNGSSFYRAIAGVITGAGPGGEREGSFKGEGIAGTPQLVYNGTAQVDTGVDGYPNGSRGRGAPGNAGGGGQNQNGGGGGGGNGGLGGNGGGGWDDVTRPTTFRDMGGLGGDGMTRAASILALSVNRMIMGGGGGAGHVDGGGTNCELGGWGGNGGGMVILKAGAISGTGNIRVSGSNGFGPNAGGSCTDAAGGGGAGGTVYVAVDTGALSGLTITAGGGNGLNSTYTQHGPGGGGGGGLVRYTTPGAAPASVVTGGANGVDASAPPVAWFSTAGTNSAAAGAATPAAETRPPNPACYPNLTVTKSTTTPTITANIGGVAIYTVSVSNAGSGAAMAADLVDNALPTGWTAQAVTAVAFSPTLSATVLGGYVEGATPGTPAVANSPGGPANFTALGTAPSSLTAPFFGNLTIPAFGGVTVTYTASIPDTATVGTYHNSAGVQYLDPVRTTAARVVAAATNNAANRCSTAGASTTGCSASGNTVAATTNTTYQSGGAVPGGNYSGLVAGPATENVRLIPDFSVSKTAPSTAATSSTFIYTITATNTGRPVGAQAFTTTQATDVLLANVPVTLASSPITITDTLPAGISITTAFAAPGITCTGTSTVVCTEPNATAYPIASGANFFTVTATARITANCTTPATTRTNTVTVSIGAGELTTANNTATASLSSTCAANLQITKTNGTTTVAAGSATTYVLTITNSGPDLVSNAVLTDATVVGLACTTATCTTAGGSVCPAPSVPFGSLTAGLVLPSLPVASTLSFTLSCGITATGQ